MIEFVKRLPENFKEEYLMCETSFGMKYALVQIPDNPDSFRVVFQDYVINCDVPFILRKFKTVFCEQWHGRWASDAPLFTEYLSLVHKLQIVWVKWCQDTVKNSNLLPKNALPDPNDFRVGDFVKIPSRNSNEWELLEERPGEKWFAKNGNETAFVQTSQLIFVRRPGRRRLLDDQSPALGFAEKRRQAANTAVAVRDQRFESSAPSEPDERQRFYDDLGGFLNLHIDSLDDTQFKTIQAALSKFYKLPRLGEIVIIYEKGAHLVSDFEFKKRDKVYVICTSIVDGTSRAIPMAELVLTPQGVWHRKKMGGYENVQWAASWFRLPSWVAVNWLATWKQQEIMRFIRTNLFPVAWLGGGRYNALMMTLITLIPSRFDTVWDWTVGYFLEPSYREVQAADITLELGTRTYMNAITGNEESVQESNTVFNRLLNFGKAVGDTFSKAGELGSAVIKKTTETVTTIFYGAVILGTLAVTVKIFS